MTFIYLRNIQMVLLVSKKYVDKINILFLIMVDMRFK